ncbi:MAG: histidine kinase [Oscillospiraceae bacterium]|nr:histidine kinase [Oscillospiraceae bacterium]
MTAIKLIRRVSVRTRLLAALLAVSIVPVILIGIYANQVYSRLFTGELSDFAEQTIRNLDTELTAELRRYELFIDAVSVSDEVQDSLVESRGGTALRREVERIILRRDYFRDIIITDIEGDVLYDAGRLPRDSLHLLMSLTDMTSPSDSLYHVGGASGGSMTIGRKIYKYPIGSEPIGYIFAFINDALPNEVIFNKVSFGGGSITLLTADGIVLAGSEAPPGTRFEGSLLFDEMLTAESAGMDSFTTNVDGVPSLAVFSRNTRYNTYLIAAIPLLNINEGTGQVGRQLVFLALVTTAVCVALSMLIYRSVAADLEDMTQTRMADQRRKRDLELEALQYQINPHFLFNTLGTLKWAAVINEAPSVISEGLTSLSQLLQSVLMNKDEMVPLSEELDNLAHYFTIQKIRYADCFEVVSEVDETVLESMVPRFILQPLAENAVLHGSEGGGRNIVITVRCRSVPGGVLLEIEDNGSGFDPEIVKRKSEARFSGIGLTNVDERLKLYYGDENGLKIQSTVGIGTVCRVFVPGTPEEDETDG